MYSCAAVETGTCFLSYSMDAIDALAVVTLGRSDGPPPRVGRGREARVDWVSALRDFLCDMMWTHCYVRMMLCGTVWNCFVQNFFSGPINAHIFFSFECDRVDYPLGGMTAPMCWSLPSPLDGNRRLPCPPPALCITQEWSLSHNFFWVCLHFFWSR